MLIPSYDCKTRRFWSLTKKKDIPAFDSLSLRFSCKVISWMKSRNNQKRLAKNVMVISLPVEWILKFLLVLKPSVLFVSAPAATKNSIHQKIASLHKFKLKSFFKKLEKERKKSEKIKNQEYNLNIVCPLL